MTRETARSARSYALLAALWVTGAPACSDDDAAPQGGSAGDLVDADLDALEVSGLRPFTPPSDPGPKGILFTASGEVFARTGYAFPPESLSDAVVVDGWRVSFDRVLATFDAITLSDNPDLAPGDQAQSGPVLAEARGPWAVDLVRSSSFDLAGKGSPGEAAVPLAALRSKASGDDFETDGTRYAFGFELVPATPLAYDVNLDAAALAEYAAMSAASCTVLYVGTATFAATGSSYESCDVHPDWPKTVSFRLCFRSPTAYRNCQNPDNDPAAPLAGEEHQRGIALSDSRSTVGQLTLHIDHPFWDSVLHDSPMHFDQYAARAAGQDAAPPLVTLEDLRGVDYTAVTDALGQALSWRYCVEPDVTVHPKFTGPMRFDPRGVPHAINADAGTGLSDYYDFATYNQSTQGHLNSDGLCSVGRKYPSPR